MKDRSSKGSGVDAPRRSPGPGPAPRPGRTARRPRGRRPAPGRCSRPTAGRRRRRPNRRPGRRPGGIRLTSRTSRRPADGHQGPGHQVVRARRRRRRPRQPLGARRPLEATVDRRPGRRAVDHQGVGQVEGDHLRLEQVVAVGPHPGDPQRQGELGRGASSTVPPSGRPTGPACRLTGRPASWSGRHQASRSHSARPSSSARAVGRDAGGLERLGADQSVEGPPQHLAAVGESGPHHREQAVVGGVARARPTAPVGRARSGRRSRRTSTDSTLGRGMKPRPAPGPPPRRVGPVGHLDRHRPVGLVAGAGGQPLPHLPLDHHQQRGHLGRLLQHPDHQGHGHVVGQVGHQRPGPARRPRRPGPAQQVGPVEGQGVGLDHPDAQRLDLGAEHRQHVPVDLDRGDRGPRLHQGQGQRPEPGPDLHHRPSRGDPGQADDPADGVAVGHEVLAQRPAGAQVVGHEQLVDLRSPVGHPVSVSPSGTAHRIPGSSGRPARPAGRSVTRSAGRR